MSLGFNLAVTIDPTRAICRTPATRGRHESSQPVQQALPVIPQVGIHGRRVNQGEESCRLEPRLGLSAGGQAFG
jgi:hypothetical protein